MYLAQAKKSFGFFPLSFILNSPILEVKRILSLSYRINKIDKFYAS